MTARTRVGRPTTSTSGPSSTLPAQMRRRARCGRGPWRPNIGAHSLCHFGAPGAQGRARRSCGPTTCWRPLY
eukprot:6636706-Pyramimonas_sp.AAC.1